ncbi:hypothetical protein B0F90DRAFT_1665227 [Multifurca ochricompacta]|uniref:Uncharacterized protein n=1 Tax=Multifurca ochricompacta TaxID=376703 RepID=A0AAD4MC14_9AGAM|nr:hypothetical protein B0F90DRAFT_1665227 [Multifurca ochricompacta]
MCFDEIAKMESDLRSDNHIGGRPQTTTSQGIDYSWLALYVAWNLIGNERVRQRGRREMKEARANRAYYRQRAQDQAGGGSSGPFSLFRFGSFGGGSDNNNNNNNNNNQSRNSSRAAAPAPQRHRSSASRHHRSVHQAQTQPPPSAQRKTAADITIGAPRVDQSPCGTAVRILPRAGQVPRGDPRRGVDWKTTC